MKTRKWRFPDNGYTDEHGLDTSDMEMFKKDPVSSLAREICQNSIDAAYGKKPVKVEFSLFQIERDRIPGIEELTEQIEKCYQYKKESPKEGAALRALKKNINKSNITCLRISDFNTTGIEGAHSKGRDNAFYNLTKGSGISDKNGSCGGSKGIGKFASFVASTTNTVFYSTYAKDDSRAYIGVSKLRSTPIDGNDDLLTLGIGYYGEGDRNAPINGELHIDDSFNRAADEFGTDIYIIGFNALKGWQYDIIAKVLDSFMVAIMFGDLEVIVDNISINNQTINGIISSEEFINGRGKKELREIKAQHELLQENNGVIKEELKVGDNNSITIYLKQYDQKSEKESTKRCVMVRYPYMKIKDHKTGALLPYSALCIIHENELNQKLRAIENPQHTDWEIKRLNDFPEEKKNTNDLKRDMERVINEFIRNTLSSGSGESTDIEGAGQFLPAQDDLGNATGASTQIEQMKIHPMTRTKTQNPPTVKAGEEGETYEFGTGEYPGSDGEGRKPKKKQNGPPEPNPNPKPEPKGDPSVGPGNTPILRKTPLSGMRYRTVATNKADGEYDCIFKSLYNEDECEFAIRICGEATDKFPINIISAKVNGVDCSIESGKIIGIKIEKDKTYKISYKVDSNEMFASEVIMNANR